MNFKHGFDSKNPNINPDCRMISNAEIKKLFYGYEGNIKDFLDGKDNWRFTFSGNLDPVFIHNLIKFGMENNLIFNGYEEKAEKYKKSYEFEGLEKLISLIK